MNGSTGGRPTASEHHLGDRLTALIDGELGHDSRERVLAHLATCWSCKAEADAQRRVKSVFADVAPPAPSDGFLARLQGLAGCADIDGDGDPRAPRALAGEAGRRRRDDVLNRPALPEGLRGTSGHGFLTERGFRIHEMERPGPRGRRFAFVAAGAVSLAALAISGALTTDIVGDVTTPPADHSDHPAGSVRAASERGGASGEGEESANRSGRPFDLRTSATTSPLRPDGFVTPLRSAMVLAPPLLGPLAPTWRPGANITSSPSAGAPWESPPSASPSAAPTGVQPLAGEAPQAAPSATGFTSPR